MKKAVCAGIGIALSAVAQAFGGWDAAMTTLVSFMAVDYVTGMTAAAVFHRSKKTADGTLESRAGWKGLLRKGVSLLVVLVASRLDAVIGSAFVRDAAVIGFIANEGLSILENAGLMGVPIPKAVTSAIHVLRDRADRDPTVSEASEANDKESETKGGGIDGLDG